jgi:hypothetical protein
MPGLMSLVVDSFGWNHADVCREARERMEVGDLVAAQLDPSLPDLVFTDDPLDRVRLASLAELRAHEGSEEGARFVQILEHRQQSLKALFEAVLDFEGVRPSALDLAQRTKLSPDLVTRSLTGKRVVSKEGERSSGELFVPVPELVAQVLELLAENGEPVVVAKARASFGSFAAVGYEGWAPRVGATIAPKVFDSHLVDPGLAQRARARFGVDLVVKVEDDEANEAPLVAPEALATHLARADDTATFEALGPDETAPVGVIFEHSHRWVVEGVACRPTVRAAGTLRVESGVLAVGDAQLPASVGLVRRRVAPGVFVVELAEVDLGDAGGAGTRVAALRLLLRAGRVTRWVAATTIGGAHHVGVDSGLVVVSDAAELLRRSRPAWLRLLSANPVGEPAPFAVTVVAGWGDGQYPCFWGLDEADVPVQFVIDFGVVTLAPEER